MDVIALVIVALLALAAGGALGYLAGRSSGSTSGGDASLTAALTAERDRALTDAVALRDALSAEQQQREDDGGHTSAPPSGSNRHPDEVHVVSVRLSPVRRQCADTLRLGVLARVLSAALGLHCRSGSVGSSCRS